MMEGKRPTHHGGYEMSEDLLMEIFSRLPAHSAARCAALSRRWRKIVDGPDFWIRHHRPPSPNFNMAYIHEYTGEGDHRPLQHAFHLPGLLAQGLLSNDRHGLAYRYVGTCNGLVALQVEGLYHHSFFACVVLNPATTEEATLTYLGLCEDHYLCGFGYGPASKTYKLLVVRRPYGCRYGGPLEVLSLGDARGEARAVFPNVWCNDTFSLCIGGVLYVLVDKHLSVLALDVDSEAISAVELPVGRVVCSEPMEVRGRLCIAMHTDETHEFVLWVLTASLDWERRCVLRYMVPTTLRSHWLVGAWDSGENRLLVWYRGAGLRLYDLREMDSGGAHEPAGSWTLEDQKDLRDYMRWGYGQYRLCWGYRPTTISPRVTIANCAGVPPVLCSFRSGRQTPQRPVAPFSNVLLDLVKTILVGQEVRGG
uniref:F-box domain-containing protein n=1 Tax=Hordeum vulgare subsp. vulgare TaxID=112509 RepID=A0A8I6XI50_HORVV